MSRASRLCLPLAVLLWMQGSTVRCSWSAWAAPAFLRPGIVFVIDGAGGFEAASRSIRDIAHEAHTPLDVRTFSWTHGYCRIFSDQMHEAHQREEGRILAEVLRSCRQEAADQPIYVIGHSAGCGVVLAAAENLPPNTLTRIVLLAPAVSAHYDLRPALRSACQGVDVFTSSHDWLCLGLGTLVLGTTDRYCTTRTAGKIGFQPLLVDAEDTALYGKLRQYPWDPSLTWTGHKGGHYGSYQAAFFRTFVLPLLQP